MSFNYDLLIVVGSIIVGGVFTYTFYNNIFTTNHSESLVNTTTQTSTLDSISQLPVVPVNHVDIGIQTESKSLWSLFKDWLREVFSANSSDYGSFGNNRVNNWIDNLSTIQVTPSQASLQNINVINQASVTNLDTLVNASDSASNILATSSVEIAIPNIELTTHVGNALLNVDPMFINTTVSGIQYIDPVLMLMC